MSSDASAPSQSRMEPIDWKSWWRECETEAMNNPPFKMFKSFKGDFDRRPTTAAGVVAMEKHNRRLYPNAIRWHENHVETPQWRAKSYDMWPDMTDNWEDDVEDLIEDGVVKTEIEAYKYLYKEDENFKRVMDECWKEAYAADKRENLDHLWAVLHRRAIQIKWMAILAGKYWRPAATGLTSSPLNKRKRDGHSDVVCPT